MIEKMIEIAKRNVEKYGIIMRIDIQFNYIKCYYEGKIWYSSGHTMILQGTCREVFDVVDVEVD